MSPGIGDELCRTLLELSCRGPAGVTGHCALLPPFPLLLRYLHMHLYISCFSLLSEELNELPR